MIISYANTEVKKSRAGVLYLTSYNNDDNFNFYREHSLCSQLPHLYLLMKSCHKSSYMNERHSAGR